MRNLYPLSRRRVLCGAVLLACAPRLPALAAATRRERVNVADFYRHDWAEVLERAMAVGKVVTVPASLHCEGINRPLWMPPQTTIHVAGSLSGGAKGRLILSDGYQLIGESQGSLRNLVLDVRGSDCVIRGLDISGFSPVAMIFIGGKTPSVMRNLLIEKLHVHDANYAILRQGFHNCFEHVRILHCRFSRLQGDAIEWNVAINDCDLLISDHQLEDINCTNGKINWGIGIGLAGSTYDNDYPDSQAVKNFVVANITGRNCRQLVHVENGKHFVIRHITATDITPAFSKNAGIDNATIAIYGCDNFIIENVNMKNSAGVLIGYGVVKGRYLSIPQNFRLNDVTLHDNELPWALRGVQIAAGNADAFVAITNVRLYRAALELHNQPQHLFLRNIVVMQTRERGPALRLHFDLRNDVRGKFMAKNDALLSLANISATDENGADAVEVDRAAQQNINATALNFTLPQKR